MELCETVTQALPRAKRQRDATQDDSDMVDLHSDTEARLDRTRMLPHGRRCSHGAGTDFHGFGASRKMNGLQFSARDALAFLLDRASFITASEAHPRHDAPLRISAAKRNDRAIVGKCSVEPWKRIGHRRNRHCREDWFPGDSAVALRSLAGGSRECLPLPPMRRVAIVLTHRVTDQGSNIIVMIPKS